MSDVNLPPCLNRRRLLGGAAVLGIAAPVLAACGSDDTTTGSASPATSSSPTAEETLPKSPPAGGGQELVATAEVPVGGGVILDDQKIVVTQPTEGDFKAFTAVCTHQGCVVGSVDENVITCPCHGSQYSAEDGTVVTGPATGNLTPIDVTVKGDQVVES
jgi:Rieske Fe-S protein